MIIIQKALHGPFTNQSTLSDFNRRVLASLGLLVLTTLWLGLFPQAVLNVSEPALKQLMQDFDMTGHR
jgi:NADH-quinone oxidoreductase subunit M